MTEPSPLTLVAEISIVRAIDRAGREFDEVAAVDGNGDPLPLALALTMLRNAGWWLTDDDTRPTYAPNPYEVDTR